MQGLVTLHQINKGAISCENLEEFSGELKKTIKVFKIFPYVMMNMTFRWSIEHIFPAKSV